MCLHVHLACVYVCVCVRAWLCEVEKDVSVDQMNENKYSVVEVTSLDLLGKRLAESVLV